MDVFKIHITKGWACPPVLKQISPPEWVTWLESIARIMVSTETRISAKSNEDFKEQIESELRFEKEKLKKDHETALNVALETNKTLEKQLRELKITNDETLKRNESIVTERYEKEIKTLRDTLTLFETKNSELLQQLGESQKQTIKYFEDKKTELETIYKANFIQEQQLLSAERKEMLLERKKLEEEIEARVSKNYTEQITLMSQTIESLKQMGTWKQSLEETFRDIQLTIQPIKRMYQGSNEEKGSLGEKSVFDFIASADYFADGLLRDTSNQAHYGDMHFNWRTMRCLIEVKNKKKIATTDITKFESDIRFVKNNEKTPCNCALFVALTAAAIDEKPREKIQVEIIHGIPAIYMMVDRPEEIQPVLVLLEKITKLERFDKSAVSQKVVQHFLDYKKQTENMIKFLSEQISKRQKEIRDFTKQLNEFYSNMEKINIDTPTFIGDLDHKDQDPKDPNSNSDPNTHNGHSDQKIGYEDIKKFYIERTLKSHRPTRLDVAQHFGKPLQEMEILLNDEIEKKICLEYLKTVMNDNLIKSLLEYKQKNTVWPTRTVLVKDYISDAQLRKLNKFFGSETLKTLWVFVEKSV